MGKIRALYAGIKLDAQQKFLLFIVFLGCVFAFNFGYEFYTISRISHLSQSISNEALSLTKGVEAAYRTMLNGRFVFGELLQVQDALGGSWADLRKMEADFESSLIIFDVYLAAMMWGSESNAFKHSDGGLNFLEWNRLGLQHVITIKPPSPRQQQLAGAADIYFSGFALNAFRAIGDHKKALRLKSEGESELAVVAEASSREHFERAKRFFNLSFETLSIMVDEANVSAVQALETINTVQRNARVNAILVFSFGFFISLLIIWFYTKSTGTMLSELDSASKMLIRKDRELTAANAELHSRNVELNEIGKVLVGRDLELSRSNERLMEVDEVKSQFVSTAAHQLRTPLTSIRWSLNELLEGDFGELVPEQKSILTETATTTNRLITLVNDLLDMARLDEGREEFNLKDDDVTQAIQKAHEQFKKIAAAKGVVFTLDISSQLPRTVLDSEKIYIAITNLVDNAIKYTPPSGTVAVSASSDSKNIYIHVSDTGIGVPENQANRLFSRFFRAHNAILMETYGSGLGLSVAKSIMDKHGGSISHEKREGGGSIFTLALPVRQAAR
ncbi:HAMP domain-containing histidine kinase [Candidatus Kaiserbacteria bacterium]|nr:HAMP domain-containing histidine kinase [Candidatus Kaiserbacteria bacterium]